MKEQLAALKQEANEAKIKLETKLKTDAQKQRAENQQREAAQRKAQMMDQLKAENIVKNRGGHEVTLQQLVLDNAEETLKQDVHSYVDFRSAMMGLIKSFADLNALLDHEFKLRFAPGFHDYVTEPLRAIFSKVVDTIDPPAEAILPELVYAVTVDKDGAIHCADLLDANAVALELGPLGQEGADLLNQLFRKYVETWLVEKKEYEITNDPKIFKPKQPENALTQEVLSKELKKFLATDAKNDLKYSEMPSPRPR